MKRMTGIGASEGVSIGKVLLFITEEIVVPETKDENSTIEAELTKGPIDIKHDETRVNFIKVPIRSFLMEYASCCQETLNLVKPKRVR